MCKKDKSYKTYNFYVFPTQYTRSTTIWNPHNYF